MTSTVRPAADPSTGSPRTAKPDAVCAAAVDLARAAAAEVAAPQPVGEHLGLRADDERLVTHYFRASDPAYVGWHWAVTLTRASRAKAATVDEVVLLPGDDALLAPAWVPWSERLRPGDLGVGDLLPTPEGDPRLVPTLFAAADEQETDIFLELGLGRARVLSVDGRLSTAERWYDGEPGPTAAIAKAAPSRCGSCGFYVPLSGALRQAFGACANEYAPDDGRVVAVDHGCGAHSEGAVASSSAADKADVSPPLLDEIGFDLVGAHPPGSVGDTDASELLGHS